MFHTTKQRLTACATAAVLFGTGAALAGNLTTAPAQAAAKAPVSRAQTVVGPTSDSGQISVAYCPSGMKVLNGGYNSITFSESYGGEPYDAVRMNAPTMDGKGWFANLLTGKIQARAVCVPDAEAPRVAVGPTSGEHSDSDARCPAGTNVIGGGFVAQTWRRNNLGESQDDVTANAPIADGKGWYARQFGAKVQARALCS
ncbi:hypothetical protein AB0L85_15190 [Streptomyces sp. NPDC052051]|uniref:hypothetical protein n=1 Tax=Streptomyces sp. NPDC052051 TaxID=3154649 RepID=UPI0034415CD0